ncbi:MAG: FG-GAP repeat domain-containing protein [Planctomycetota bacterium]
MTSKSLFFFLLAAGLSLPACKRSRSAPPARPAPVHVKFQTRTEIAVQADSIRAFAMGDFTGDGTTDILCSSMVDRKVLMLVGSGNGAFSVQEPLGSPFLDVPGEIVGGDFDGDKDLDFALLFNLRGTVNVYWNNGLGGFTAVKPQTLTGGTNACGLTAGDVDGDGKSELLFCGDPNQLQIHHTDSTGFFPNKPTILQAKAGSVLGFITLADLDADGTPEICVCDYATDRDEVLIWKKTGPNAYSLEKRMKSGGFGPLSVVAAKLDSDANIDLIVANWTEGTLSLFRGLGGLTYSTVVKVKLAGQPFHLATGDINQDGALDLIISYWPGYSIAWLAGDGAGGFLKERQFSTTGMPTMSRLVDVDEDGNLDVLTSGTNARFLSLFRGRGKSGILGAELFLTGGGDPRFVVSDDFDKDGFADAIVSDTGGGFCTVLRGSSTGRFATESSPPLQIDIGRRPGFLTKGDFDSDGRMDVVVGVQDGLRFLVNRTPISGRINFEVFPDLKDPAVSVGTGPFEVVAANFDGDAINDLAIADRIGGKVVIMKGQGGFNFSRLGNPVNVPGGPVGLVTGDFNLDGLTDLAVSRFDSAAVTVLCGFGDGTFGKLIDLDAGPNPNYLRVADFDNNGISDIVVSNIGKLGQFISNKLTLYLGRSINGKFTFDQRDIVVGTGPTALMARDLDRDGEADILVSNYHSADLLVLLGVGNGSFEAPIRFPGTFRSISADLGDMNADGLPDIVVASDFELIWGVGLYLNRSQPVSR